MAVGVSMESPIPTYANFGENITRNWNQARELALKEDTHAKTHELNLRTADLNERGMQINEANLKFNQEKWEFEKGRIQAQKKLAGEMDLIKKYKAKYASEQDDLYRQYQKFLAKDEDYSVTDYLDVFGIRDTSYWDDERKDMSFEEWQQDYAGGVDSYSDYGQYGILPMTDEGDLDLTGEALRALRHTDPILDSTVGATDAELDELSTSGQGLAGMVAPVQYYNYGY